MCPRLFTIGSFSVPTYGLLVALGFLVGLMIVARLSRRVGLDPDTMTNLGIYVALAAIVGAKVFMILSNLGYYIESPGRIFSLSSLQAGGVFYGGLLAALGVAVWYSRRASLAPLQTADVLAPAVAIGHSIGRLGCFAAGCCWGKETDLPWGVVFTNPIAHDFVGVPLNVHCTRRSFTKRSAPLPWGWCCCAFLASPTRRARSWAGIWCCIRASASASSSCGPRATVYFPSTAPSARRSGLRCFWLLAGGVLLSRQKKHPYIVPLKQPA